MLTGLGVIAGTTAIVAGLGLVERVVHRRRLARIPIRIHVSGTRGKSSVTRLIAAGLRHAGVRTAAKTTGTTARMLTPDGREYPIFRPAGASVIEQKRVVAASCDLGAEALVIECMALQPALHWVSENMLVRATHGVITNARADHLDVMGPTEADVARTLAGMIPVRGVLYTAERRHLDIIRAACEDRETRLVAVSEEEVASVSDEEMAGFCYTEHPENVAVTLKILGEQGISRQDAIAGMWTTTPDPGALTEIEVDFFGRQMFFVNAFAANDPESTEQAWAMARERRPNVDRTVAVFNLRADRPARTAQLAGERSFWQEADSVVLMGTGAYLFARAALRHGVDPSLFVYADNRSADEVFESIVGVCGRRTLIVGMGNIGGEGLELVQYFGHRSLPDPSNSGDAVSGDAVSGQAVS